MSQVVQGSQGASGSNGAGGRKGLLERALSVFTEVEPGEAGTALLLALNVFVLLGAYYVLKVVREPLILRDGAANKVYASALMALLLVPLLKGFEWLSERVDRMQLIAGTTGFFVACLGVFALLAQMGAHIGFAFFVWVGVFNMFVVAQFWAFANDVYTEAQGKRLFPIVAVGSSLGAIVGGRFAGQLFDADHLGRMFLLAAVLIAASVGLTYLVHRRAGAATPASGAAKRASAAPSEPAKHGALKPGAAFTMLMRNRYLLLIALLVVVYNCVNTVGEFILDRGIIHAAHGTPEQISAYEAHFRATFFTVVNVVGLVLQLFAVSRVLRYFGVRVALFVMPVVSLLGYTGIAAAATLSVMFAAKAAENSMDYSVQSTTRQALFLRTSREAKYKAKALIDTFFVRSGDLVAAGLVWLGTGPLNLSERGFAVLNLALVGVWLAIAWRIGIRYATQTPDAPDASSPTPPTPHGRRESLPLGVPRDGQPAGAPALALRASRP